MSQTEAHVLKITLDASDVDKGLMRARTGIEDLQKSATKSAGGLKLIQGGLQGIDKAEREASKALRGLGQSFGGLNTSMMNTTGLIGDVASLLAGGGAIAIAMAAGGFAVSAFTKHMENLSKEADAVLEKDWARISEIAKNLGVTTSKVAELNAALKGPKTEADLRKESADRINAISRQIELIEAESDAAKVAAALSASAPRTGGARGGFVDRSASEKEATKEQMRQRELGLLNQSVLKEQERLEKEIAKLTKDTAANTKATVAAKKELVSVVSYDLDAGQMLADAEANRQSMRDAPQIKASEELAKELERADQAKHERALNRAFEQIDAQQKVRDEIDQTWAGFGEQMTGTLVGGVAGGFTTLFAEMAAGNKHAAEIALSSFLSSTGQQIVASGVQSVVQGTLYAVNPITAAAAPGMIAAGVAAIGVGTAMAAGGAGINASIPRPGGAAAGGRGSSSERGTGSGSSRSGGGDGGGATVININYAAGGPNPEDTARDISNVLDTARRRRFNQSNRRSL